MDWKNKNRLHWLLSGALGAGMVMAPTLTASAQQTSQQAPTAGQQGDWGPAGPPPDAQNGQIPQQDTAQPDQNGDQGPPQYPGMSNQDPNQAPSQYPNQAPQSGAGVGYNQGARPAYQPGQNPSNGYQAAPLSNVPPSGPVTLSSGLLLPIRTSEPLDSKKLKPGDYFQGTVAQSIYVGNVLAIPRGAQVTGRVVDVKKAGELKGGASIALQLTTLNLGGNSYSLTSDTFDTNSPGKGGYTAANTVGGAALGAAIGAIAGGGPGAAIGAVAGTGVGLGASAATPGPRSMVPAEALLTFHLTSPVTVQPVSPQEAARIQASVAPQGRPGYPPPPPYGYPAAYAPPPPGYAPYPYAYPYAYGYPYPYAYAYPYRYRYGYPYYYRRW
ncbi:MAG TPA: hypothetical protein VMB49_11985 [Acidobacteriaceae bacterium]|nr:hypothetical protein [Acidobacteriaceae bacterium]